ncbi:hypothetical protein BDQ17DRAFT_316501 [Cyathus striatus]|nr:hypothetical protein BDQ17DRAFT_316501 [Cyathus striatus]
MLTKEDVMRAWDPTGWMLRYYRVRCDVVDAADAFELPDHQRPNISPVFGKQVELPKAKKGHDSIHALHFLRDSRTVWAETKYDGERAQIHVEVVCNDPPKITIFSKSKRDSTWERRAVHSTILEALGFPLDNPQLQARSSKVAIQNIILDAEMVAFKGVKVDEFWRIRPLIGRAAYGVQDSKQLISRRLPGTELCSDIPENRRLGLVFFDILMLNSVSLLQTPYSHRREMLESLIKQVPGKAILSARYPINMKGFQPSNELRRIFAQHIADHEEGLILKAEESQYNDYNFPWVKFKKDYIEGYGDCIDLVVIGAGWDKERGRELRVPPSTYTTFYIGALANSGQRIQNPIILPHFFVYFTVSYGLTRDQLEEVNFLIKSSDRVLYDPSMMNNQMPYTFTVFSGISSPPRVVLRVPLLAELFGAGFTKSANCMHYELRFPRITKIHRKQERTWEDAIRLDELNSIAMESAGVKKPENDIDEWAGDLFGKSSVPGTSTPRKREATKDYWSKRLFSLDHAAAGKRGIILLHAQDKGGLVASENAVSASETFSSSNSQSSAPGANNVIGGLCLGTTSAALTSAGSSHNARTIFKPSEPDTMMLEDISNFTHMTVVAPRPSRSVFKSMSSRKVAFLKDKLISFVGYSGRCLHCKKLKRSVSVTRRVHCVASLLSGCDWVAEKNGMNSSWIGGGS